MIKMATVAKLPGERWREPFLFLIMSIAVAIFKLPTLRTPYFWDEMGAYMEPSHWLSQQSLVHVLPGLHPPDMFFGHPPLLYWLAAVIFKLFGLASSGPHLLCVGFSLFGLFYTYRLGLLLYGSQVGVAAAILLFAMPLYFAQAGMFLGDIPVAALGVMTVYYALTYRYPAFLLTAFCLVMTKETGVAVVVAIVIYHAVCRRGETGIRRALLLAVPLVPLALFFAAQKITTGSLLPNPYFTDHTFATFTPMNLLLKGGEAIYTVFLVQFRFVLTAVAIAGLVFCRPTVFRRELILFLIITIFFIGAFSAIFALPRYFLPVLPYLAITSAASIFALCKSTRKAWGSTAFCVILFLLAMYGNSLLMWAMHGNRTRGLSLETNLEYLNVVSTYRQAGEFLELNYPGTPIYAPWPLNQALSAPYLGYISRPLVLEPELESANIFVFSEQSTDSQSETMDRFIANKNLRPLRIFERHGRSTAIYLVPAKETR